MEVVARRKIERPHPYGSKRRSGHQDVVSDEPEERGASKNVKKLTRQVAQDSFPSLGEYLKEVEIKNEVKNEGKNPKDCVFDFGIQHAEEVGDFDDAWDQISALLESGQKVNLKEH